MKGPIQRCCYCQRSLYQFERTPFLNGIYHKNCFCTLYNRIRERKQSIGIFMTSYDLIENWKNFKKEIDEKNNSEIIDKLLKRIQELEDENLKLKALLFMK
jgi:hypothetical protein